MSFSIFSSKPRPALFTAVLLIMLGMLAVIVWTAKLYFLKSGDLLGEQEVVKIQLSSSTFCPYQSRAANNHGAYKLALYQEIKPDVVVIGSSVMLQFASPMFNASFANLGRTMNYLIEGPPLLEELVRAGKPKLAIVGLDFWWFNPNHNPRKRHVLIVQKVVQNNPAMLKALVGEVMSNPAMLKSFNGLFDAAGCPLGIAAKAYLQGFGRDGFMYYGGRFSRDPKLQEDYQFRDTLKRIETGKRKFQPAGEPRAESVEMLIQFVNSVKAEGIEVVLVVPPVAPTVFGSMQQRQGYGYIEKAIDQIRDSGLEVFDFQDPSLTELDDCDFLDGFHFGDTASARMLKAMTASHASLKEFVNLEEVERLSRIKGRAAVYFHERFHRQEPDFLGLGCAKQE